ncbi:MAG: SpoIIE family protein phosphatase [bacterium]|nr:SpoIIE family protein phosphatase [bacterium]
MQKTEYIDIFSRTKSFKGRADKLCIWVKRIYGYKKAILFYRCDNEDCYTKVKYSGLRKASLKDLIFQYESVLKKNMNYNISNGVPGRIPLNKWNWFSAGLLENLNNNGFTDIIPFWAGRDCLGGFVLDINKTNRNREMKEFEDVLKDLIYMLEISFLEQLRNQEIWEKNVILDVGKKISELKDLQSVLDSIIDSLHDVISYDAAGIFLVEMPAREINYKTIRGYSKDKFEKISLKVGKGIIGWSIKHKQIVNVHDVRKDDRYISARDRTRSELSVPIKYGDKVLGAINLESNSTHFFNHHHIDLLKTFAAQSAVVIQNSRLFYKTLEIKEIKKEMAIAKGVQSALLPQREPEKDGYDFAARNVTSLAIGGDLYDFVSLSDDLLGVAIGDVSGKGVPGAMLMAALYSAFRGQVRKSEHPEEVINYLNTSLYEQTESNKFATFFYGVLNTGYNTFNYTNAGHNYPLLIKKDGSWAELSKGGPLLGFLPEIKYSSGKIELGSDDIVLLYTDGVSEAFNEKEEEFGIERLVETVHRNREKTATDIIERIIDKVIQFSKRRHQDDDLTLVIIKKL